MYAMPRELIDMIIMYLPITKVIKLNDRLALIKYNTELDKYEELYRESIINGDLVTVKWLYANDFNNIKILFALMLAAKNGHIEVFKFLYSQHDIACDFVIDARNPSENLGIWAFARTTSTDLMLMPDCTSRAWSEAVKNKHFEIVDWINANGQISCRARRYSNEIVQRVLKKRDFQRCTEFKFRIHD